MNDFFDLIGTFFAQLANEEKILLGILALLLFAFGVIVGWIVQGTKTRRYKKELLLLRKDRDEYEVRYRAADTKQKAMAKELEAISREKVDALDRIQALTTEVGQRDASLTELQQRNEELVTTNQSYATTIESLNDQVIGLKTQNEQLIAGGTTGNTGEGQDVPEGEGTSRGVAGPAGAGGSSSGSNESLNAYISVTESRFQTLENRLLALAEENAALRGAAATTSTATPGFSYQPHQPVINQDQPTAAQAEPLVIRADTTEPGVRTGLKGDTEVIVQTTPSVHIPVMSGISEDHHDDLTRIKDIGPFLQQKLNEADIYSYEQIANWSEADVMTYTELIGYLPGIIQRDDWIGQAAALAAEPDHAPEASPAPAEAPAPEPVEKPAKEVADDNLRIVEGIGPKIESVLKAAGVDSLHTLAATPAEQLREMLDAAGSRYKSHDPRSWPVQAGLAADGKLAELKAWQQELKGGK
ncbi:hypothetical protein [Neolewinella agarilytica]|uniref:Uncharacterized protein n=1 Tax=Neolewinella agarilytica TaxID=478744 RepID=A0A1H9GEN2_9BACT|nr:hypothetical protein [Neolewinella agarilytica]SEQ48493.1 hypothetical protein SAMN05444359_110148 [Neolewinella agarilytica]